jgi:hypothetical protein
MYDVRPASAGRQVFDVRCGIYDVRITMYDLRCMIWGLGFGVSAWAHDTSIYELSTGDLPI